MISERVMVGPLRNRERRKICQKIEREKEGREERENEAVSGRERERFVICQKNKDRGKARIECQ